MGGKKPTNQLLICREFCQDRGCIQLGALGSVSTTTPAGGMLNTEPWQKSWVVVKDVELFFLAF